MKQIVFGLLGVFGIIFAVNIKGEKVKFDKFGEVEIYRHDRNPGLAVFIIYEDPSWHDTAAEIGRSVAKDKNVAIAVDLNAYLKNVGEQKFCGSIVNDFDDLNKGMQKSLNLSRPIPVVLMGKDLGANAVELAYTKTGDETFGGFLAISACSGSPLRTLCKVDRTLPSQSVHSPLACGDHAGARKTSTAQVMTAHQELLKRAWVESIKDRLYSVAPARRAGDTGLATLEILPKEIKSDRLVVLYSGDGGWASFVQNLSAQFTAAGVPVIGVDSLKYFWSKKEPDEGARDLEALLEKYTTRFHSKHVQLIGFSQGADVLPFIVNRLPAARQSQIDRVSLLSVGKLADFEFHLDNWISHEQTGQPIEPEILKMSTARIDCVYGQETQSESACPQIEMKATRKYKFNGGHFLNWDTQGIYRKIAE